MLVSFANVAIVKNMENCNDWSQVSTHFLYTFTIGKADNDCRDCQRHEMLCSCCNHVGRAPIFSQRRFAFATQMIYSQWKEYRVHGCQVLCIFLGNSVSGTFRPIYLAPRTLEYVLLRFRDFQPGNGPVSSPLATVRVHTNSHITGVAIMLQGSEFCSSSFFDNTRLKPQASLFHKYRSRNLPKIMYLSAEIIHHLKSSLHEGLLLLPPKFLLQMFKAQSRSAGIIESCF